MSYRKKLTDDQMNNREIFESNIRSISFKDGFITDKVISGITLMTCEFVECFFDHSIFVNCRFVDVIFKECNCKSLKFYNCTFDINCKFIDNKYLRIPMICPQEGSFIGYKKAIRVTYEKTNTRHCEDVIIKLLIPEDAKRSSANSNKCRASKALVLEIQDLDGNILNINNEDIIHSIRDPDFTYTVGETAFVDNFDENRFVECSTGIHFFVDRQEAVSYF
jgi:hypothetical protein